MIFKEIYKDKPRFYVLLFFPIYLVSWFVLQSVMTFDSVNIIHCALDDLIPFCEFFVVFYIAWFFYYVGTLVWFLLKSREDYLRLGAMLIFGITLSVIIFVFFQNGVDFRPTALPSNIFGKLVELLYIFDPPRSVCPSIHCYVSICITITFFKSKKYKKNFIWSLILTLLICLSTMFIKQHSVLDFAAAAILTVPAYLISYKLIKIKQS